MLNHWLPIRHALVSHRVDGNRSDSTTLIRHQLGGGGRERTEKQKKGREDVVICMDEAERDGTGTSMEWVVSVCFT
jgi:hypothetical protein